MPCLTRRKQLALMDDGVEALWWVIHCGVVALAATLPGELRALLGDLAHTASQPGKAHAHTIGSSSGDVVCGGGGNGNGGSSGGLHKRHNPRAIATRRAASRRRGRVLLGGLQRPRRGARRYGVRTAQAARHVGRL
eukprot:365149-Chlamydomonas_euryale.AAC.8